MPHSSARLYFLLTSALSRSIYSPNRGGRFHYHRDGDPLILFVSFVSFDILAILAQGGAPAEPLPSILSGMLPVFVGIFLLYYFIVILPEKRSRIADERLKSELKKNDRVVTIGGIHAVVASVSDDSDIVTLKLDEGGTRG